MGLGFMMVYGVQGLGLMDLGFGVYGFRVWGLWGSGFMGLKFRVWGLGTLGNLYWVAVKEPNLSYYTGETILTTTSTHYGNLIQVPLTATLTQSHPKCQFM